MAFPTSSYPQGVGEAGSLAGDVIVWPLVSGSRATTSERCDNAMRTAEEIGNQVEKIGMSR